jgi:hypothetical protein
LSQFKLPKSADDKITYFFSYIREKVQQAQKLGVESALTEDFLRDQLLKAVFISLKTHLAPFLLTLRTASINKLDKAQALLTLSLTYDYCTRAISESLLELLLDYPEYSIQVLDQILREPFKPASVQPRSVKGFLDTDDEALKWITEAD